MVPRLVPLPVTWLNAPVPPAISQALEIGAGNPSEQTVPWSASRIDPVSPVKVTVAL